VRHFGKIGLANIKNYLQQQNRNVELPSIQWNYFACPVQPEQKTGVSQKVDEGL